MFCQNCGSKIEKDALFCQKCGTKVLNDNKSKKDDIENDEELVLKKVEPKMVSEKSVSHKDELILSEKPKNKFIGFLLKIKETKVIVNFKNMISELSEQDLDKSVMSLKIVRALIVIAVVIVVLTIVFNVIYSGIIASAVVSGR